MSQHSTFSDGGPDALGAGTKPADTDQPPIRRPKTRRGVETRNKILEAAEAEFGERGFHDASINGITARGGVALGSFYTYFESKEGLFRALVEHMGKLTRRYIAQRVATIPDRIMAERAGLEAFIEFTRAHRNLYRIVMEAQFVAPDVYRSYYDDFAEAYRSNLSVAVDHGQMRAGDAEIRAWALIGMSVFLGMRYGVWAEDKTPKEVADEIHRFLEGGLRA